VDKLLAETGGNLSAINKKLGTHWKGRVYRIDVHDPLLHNARLPSGLGPGADAELFRWGGYTSGGAPEVVIDRLAEGTYTIVELP
jgi:hypothetical protein